MRWWVACIAALASIEAAEEEALAGVAVLRIGDCKISVAPGSNIISTNCSTEAELRLQAKLDEHEALLLLIRKHLDIGFPPEAPPFSPPPTPPLAPPLETREYDAIAYLCSPSATDADRAAIVQHMFIGTTRGIKCVGTTAFYIYTQGPLMFTPPDAANGNSGAAVSVTWQMHPVGGLPSGSGWDGLCSGPQGGSWAPVIGPGTTHPTGLADNWYYYNVDAIGNAWGRTPIVSGAKSTYSGYTAGSWSSNLDTT